MRRIGRKIDALHPRMRRQPGRHPAGIGALPLHAQRECLDAAHGQIAFERAQHRTDGARQAAQRLVDALRPRSRCRPARRHGLPDTWSGCAPPDSRRAPAAAPAAAWRTCCPPPAPRPPSRAISAILSIAPTRSSGFEIVSIRMQPGLCSAIAARSASRSHISTNVTSTPIGVQHVHQQADGGAVQRVGRHHATCAGPPAPPASAIWMAAIPDAQASAPWPLSSAATSSSSAALVGLS